MTDPMSRGLPEPVRRYLDSVDGRVDELGDEDKAGLREQVLAVLGLYQGMAPVVLARLIMEQVMALSNALARAEEPGASLEHEVRLVMFNAAALASMLSRKSRGVPPL